MCLIVKKGTKEKIAENDIICYKDIEKDTQGKLRSAIQWFNYTIGKIYTTELRRVDNVEIGKNAYYADDTSRQRYEVYEEQEKENMLVSYNRGFHSYKNKEIVDCDRIPNYECTIPKGTKYIEDETGLICSEAIIINKILE